jgi:hypothetical protein
MDEQMIQALAMDEMLGEGAPGQSPAGMGGGMADPFASDAPPGYTMVYVPDIVLPSVMQLVEQADAGAGGFGDPSMAPPGAEMGGMGPDMGGMPAY